MKRKFALQKAHALWATGKPDQAADLLMALAPKGKSSPVHVQHQGLLRHARQLISSTDPAQQAYAMNKLKQILDQDPSQLLNPALNLLRIDCHLSQGEKRMAQSLCAQMEKLDLNELMQAQLLLRKLKLLCQQGDLPQAKQLYQTLLKDYAYSSVLAPAKQILTEALTAMPK